MNLTELTVIESRIKEGINAEYTLSIRALKSPIAIDTVITVDEEPFKVYEIALHGCNKNIMEVQAEHVSYGLNQPMPMLPDITETNPETGATTTKPNPHSMKGTYTAHEAIGTILNGTGFTATNIMTTSAKEFQLGKMSRKQALLKVAQFFNAELMFSKYTVSLVTQRGQDRGIQLKYAKNLKAIEKFTTREGIGYKVDIVELRTLQPNEEFDIGDTVEILDETIGVSTKQRILSIEYDPIRRIHTAVEIGQREETFADIYEKDVEEVDEKIKEALKSIDLPETTYNQIVEVTKETVLAAETIHASTAWIEELEVNYLRTNFDARMTNAGQTWDYVYAHEMQIEFNSAQLHATEKEQYKTMKGRPLYWTAIGSHPDAKKYFTLQSPTIPKGAKITVDGVERDLVEADFYVMVPKIVSEATKLKIAFESVEGGTGLFPVMTWGQGNGQGAKGGKAFLSKDVQGLLLQYFHTDEKYDELRMDIEGIRVFSNMDGVAGKKQVRNIHVATTPPDTSLIAEGDLWVVV